MRHIYPVLVVALAAAIILLAPQPLTMLEPYPLRHSYICVGEPYQDVTCVPASTLICEYLACGCLNIIDDRCLGSVVHVGKS